MFWNNVEPATTMAEPTIGEMHLVKHESVKNINQGSITNRIHKFERTTVANHFLHLEIVLQHCIPMLHVLWMRALQCLHPTLIHKMEGNHNISLISRLHMAEEREGCSI